MRLQIITLLAATIEAKAPPAVDARVVAAEAAGGELGGGNSVGAYLLQYVRASEAPRLGLRAALL